MGIGGNIRKYGVLIIDNKMFSCFGFHLKIAVQELMRKLLKELVSHQIMSHLYLFTQQEVLFVCVCVCVCVCVFIFFVFIYIFTKSLHFRFNGIRLWSLQIPKE